MDIMPILEDIRQPQNPDPTTQQPNPSPPLLKFEQKCLMRKEVPSSQYAAAEPNTNAGTLQGQAAAQKQLDDEDALAKGVEAAENNLQLEKDNDDEDEDPDQHDIADDDDQRVEDELGHEDDDVSKGEISVDPPTPAKKYMDNKQLE